MKVSEQVFELKFSNVLTFWVFSSNYVFAFCPTITFSESFTGLYFLSLMQTRELTRRL